MFFGRRGGHFRLAFSVRRGFGAEDPTLNSAENRAATTEAKMKKMGINTPLEACRMVRNANRYASIDWSERYSDEL